MEYQHHKGLMVQSLSQFLHFSLNYQCAEDVIAEQAKGKDDDDPFANLSKKEKKKKKKMVICQTKPTMRMTVEKKERNDL